MSQISVRPFSYTSRIGRGPRLVLIAALLFALWYTWPTPVASHLADVAREHVVQIYPWAEWGPAVRQTGHFGSYNLTFKGHREEQNTTALVSVAVSAEGARVVSAVVSLGSTSDLPRTLAQMAIAIVLFTLVFFRAIPQTFGKKCPRDGSLLRMNETMVVPPRYDTTLVTRPGIIQRTWACPKCDFHHAEALRDPHHRPTVYVDARFVTSRIAMMDGFEKKVDEGRREALARAVTDEQYEEMLAEARRSAAGASSPDSPWRKT
jgi:hypothetical protein